MGIGDELSEAEHVKSELQLARMGDTTESRSQGPGLGNHLLPLRHTAPPDMVTGGAGKLPFHGRDKVFLGTLEHA